MSLDASTQAAKRAAIVFMLFCFSWYKSCEEIKFVTSGTTVETKVAEVREAKGRRGRPAGYDVYYDFEHKERGETLEGYTRQGMKAPEEYPVGMDIQIQYIGDKRITTRIKGTGSIVWPVVFVVMIVALVWSVILLGTRDRAT